MVRVGLVTLVTSRVDSVTSTSLRVNFGDMRTVSAPILPVSSGASPGQSATTSGLSAAAAAGQATPSPARRETIHARRIVVAPLLLPGARHGRFYPEGPGGPATFHSCHA